MRRYRLSAFQTADTVVRVNEGGDANPEMFVNDDNFAAGDFFAIDKDVNGFADEFIKFDNGAGPRRRYHG